MIRIATGCKINLGLRITGRLANGFHTLESVFCPLPWPRDELRIELSDGAELELLCPGIKPRTNTVYKAWKLFHDVTGHRLGLRVQLVKRVPVGSGLGGGSANGAAMLTYLNDRCGNPFNQDELLDMAVRLGADVPFFLQKNPCAVSGIGEVIEPVALDCKGVWLVLVFPGFTSDTAGAYAAFDEISAFQGTEAEMRALDGAEGGGAPEYLTKCDYSARSPFPAGGCMAASPLVCTALDLRNDLEAAVFPRFPALGRLKGDLLRMGAVGASMSGSGSSVYGIFASDGSAHCAAQTLRQKWPRVYCMPLNNLGM